MSEVAVPNDASLAEITLAGTGAELGRYRLIRRIGSGGMGQVFAAQAKDDDSEVVALKQITILDPTLLYRFKQEFRSLADLSHPTLVRLGELVVLPTGLAFYTMELVVGQPLVRWIRRGTPSGTVPNVHRLCHALRQLAAGVAHLHRAGRVHRDLKPSNVLVTGEGRVVILDFGLVFEVSGRDARITATGQIVGTPAYMAPEQATRSAIGPPVDLYAIGSVLFECLTGCMPFVGNAIRVLLSKQREPAPDPRELAEGIPDWLAQTCRRLLDPEPAHRPSAEQLIALLDEHAPGTAPSSVTVDEARGPRLVGRDRELAVLERAHEGVASNGATVVRLTGPFGRGKSALVDHFLLSILEPDLVVLRGRCHRRESVPYKGIDSIVDALAVHLRSLPEVEAAALRPRHVRELCELFAVLQGIWRESGRRVLAQEPIMRRRLGVAALREVLGRVADASALIVVIDDFQWGDLDGLGVLGELLLAPEPPALLLILAYDADAGGPVVERIADPDALRGASFVDLSLAPLTIDAARSIALALMDPRMVDDPAARAELLARDSGGEPLALVRGITAAGPVALTEIADEAVLRRVRSLRPEPRMLLELATVANEPLANELLRVALGSDPANFEIAVRELVAAGMLAAVALETRGIIKLTQARVAELVRVELDDDRRRELHSCLAEALTTMQADLEAIAGHFEAGGDLERARALMTKAAVGAADALAFVRAEQLYRRALDLLPSRLDDDGQRERRELCLTLAEQLSNLARSREAADIYVRIASECRGEQAAKLRLRAAEQYAVSGWSQLALPLLRELMRDAGERLPTSLLGVLALFVWNRLRLRLHGPRVDIREPEDLSPEQLARFDLVYATNMALSHCEILPTLALRPRVLLLARKAGEPSRLAFALVIEASLLASIGRPARAWAAIERARVIAAQLEDPLVYAHVHSAEALYHSAQINVAAAEASIEQVMRDLERSPSASWIQAPLTHQRVLLLRQTGAYDRLRRCLPGWISLLQDLGHLQYATLLISEEILVHAQVGDLVLARRDLERGRAGWQFEQYTFVNYLLSLAEVWLLRAEGRGAAARELAYTTEAELHFHRLSRFKTARFRMRETCLYAQLDHAIESDEPSMIPSRRELRRLRRAGLPKAAATTLLLSAGGASLLGDREREREHWRQGVIACEAAAMHAIAAAARWRLAELGGDDRDQLQADARACFEREKIDDIQRFVNLMAPAKRGS